MRSILPLLFFLACDPKVEDEPVAPPPTSPYLTGSSAERLSRISMALRGYRPSPAELARVEADPAAVEALVDAWLESPEFAATVRDMWAEILQLRNDTFNQLPAVGPLEDYTLSDMNYGTTEEPLKLIEYIVVNNRPFTEILTADYMLTDPVTSLIYGVPYNFGSPEEWQLSEWPDERPRAGLLSSAQLFRRWESDGSNFHRQRANMIASKFLCEDFGARDILVAQGIDIANEQEVARAAMENPSCVSCHQSLDPLAGYFWGYKRLIHRNFVADSMRFGCEFDWSDGMEPEFGFSARPEDYCYPIRQYDAADEDDWQLWDLRAPAFYGVPARDLSDVGRLIADDPRFSRCMAQQFFSYLTETEPTHVPWDVAVELQSGFVESGFDAKALVRQVVLSDAFAAIDTKPGEVDDGVASLRVIRPEQYARTIEHLTGYRWLVVGDDARCNDPNRADVNRFGSQCWGEVELPTSDVFGFRAMQGGIDGVVITRPTHTVTPTKTLTMANFAADAAAFVVAHDRAVGPEARRLLDPSVTAEVAVRQQLADLTLAVLAVRVSPESEEITDLLALFQLSMSTHDDPGIAWALVLSALLQDPRMMFY